MPIPRDHHLLGQGGEARSQPGAGFVSMLVGVGGVAAHIRDQEGEHAGGQGDVCSDRDLTLLSPRRNGNRGAGAACRCLEGSSLLVPQRQGLGERCHEVGTRRLLEAAFQIADRAPSELGPVGQFLLRQACCLAVLP
jgi:hypothetical protein